MANGNIEHSGNRMGWRFESGEYLNAETAIAITTHCNANVIDVLPILTHVFRNKNGSDLYKVGAHDVFNAAQQFVSWMVRNHLDKYREINIELAAMPGDPRNRSGESARSRRARRLQEIEAEKTEKVEETIET